MLKDKAYDAVAYYDQRAQSFAAATVNADRSQIYQAFCQYVRPGDRLLDLGTGSGRDAKYWQDFGCKVTALDGAPQLCELAAQLLGHEVICRRFEDLTYDQEFEAIWAFSSLLHMPWQELVPMFKRLHRALVTGGYFYFSFMYGDFRGIRSERYFTDLNEKALAELLEAVGGFELLQTFITTDERPERRIDKKWLNAIVRKI